MDRDLLGEILSPRAPEAFFERFGGREAAVWALAAGARSRLDPCGALTERLLERAGRAHVQRIEGGLWAELDPREEPGPALLARAKERGASLRIRRVQTLDEELRALALALHAALGEEININLYWSGDRGASGLRPHSDGYDIFAVQVAGAKRWWLLGGDRRRFEERELAEVEPDLVAGTRGSFVLERGRALYLPAGLGHRAQNEGAEPSVHLAIGILGATSRSVIEWLAAEAAQRLGGRAGEEPRAAGTPEVEAALEAMRAILEAPDPEARFRSYREGLTYERTLASPEAYDAGSSRGYR